MYNTKKNLKNKIMKKYFVTYGQALFLKELEFNELCLGYYEKQDETLVICYNNKPLTEEEQKRSGLYKTDIKNSKLPVWATAAPLKSQAFEWFRKNYRLSVLINDCLDDYIGEIIRWTLTDDKIIMEVPNRIKTYEEAESACIDKLIEIVKKEKT